MKVKTREHALMTAVTKTIARVGGRFPEIELPRLDGEELTAGELCGEDPGPSPVEDAPYTLGSVERELVDTTLPPGRLLDSLNRSDEAVTEWQAAL